MPSRKEIGSEFWDVPVSRDSLNDELFKGAAWLRCGRDALSYVLDDALLENKMRTIGVPSYCCDSMIAPILKKGLEISFYSVVPAPNGGLSYDFCSAWDCDAVVVMDYFGYHSEWSLDGFDGLVFLDMTHTAVIPPTRGFHYAFGSLRKWAGFLGGGFAIKAGGDFLAQKPMADKTCFFALRRSAMEKKKAYISGTSDDKDSFLSDFEMAESILCDSPVASGSEDDRVSALNMDMAAVAEARRRNARKLLSYVGRWSIFKEVREDEAPLFVPILVDPRMRNCLQAHLAENGIFCPVHWPFTDWHSKNKSHKRIFDGELSLVCDQRYSLPDMDFIGFAVRDFLKESAKNVKNLHA